MIGNVPQATAGVQARACVSPAVTIAVTETVLTPATSWRGKGGICVLMLFFFYLRNAVFLILYKQTV